MHSRLRCCVKEPSKPPHLEANAWFPYILPTHLYIVSSDTQRRILLSRPPQPSKLVIKMINIRNIDCESPACYTLGVMASPTRDLVLRTLRARGKCTVKQLADAAGVSPVSVRHHLSSLQADDLVLAEEVKHGVGRPYHVFSLTEKAQEIYPGRYLRLTNRLLSEVKDHISEDLVIQLFSGVANAMADEYAAQLAGLTMQERLPRLMQMLAAEGFDAEYEWQEDRVIIREFGCPYLQVGREHPEVCTVDTRFIATALDLPVERVKCLLDGDTHCTFSLKVLDEKERLPVHG